MHIQPAAGGEVRKELRDSEFKSILPLAAVLEPRAEANVLDWLDELPEFDEPLLELPEAHLTGNLQQNGQRIGRLRGLLPVMPSLLLLSMPFVESSPSLSSSDEEPSKSWLDWA